MRKLNGSLLVLSGVLHVVVGIAAGFKQVILIGSYGIWGALVQGSQAACLQSLQCMQMNAIYWFIAWGVMLVLLGLLVYWLEEKLNQAIPIVVSILLMIVSLFCALLMPLSGFWFVAIVAIRMTVSGLKPNPSH